MARLSRQNNTKFREQAVALVNKRNLTVPEALSNWVFRGAREIAGIDANRKPVTDANSPKPGWGALS